MRLLKKHIEYEQTVCDVFGITHDQIRSKERKDIICFARYVVFKYLYSRDYTLMAIAEIFNKDHTTIISGLRQYDILKNNNAYFKGALEEINYVTGRLQQRMDSTGV